MSVDTTGGPLHRTYLAAWQVDGGSRMAILSSVACPSKLGNWGILAAEERGAVGRRAGLAGACVHCYRSSGDHTRPESVGPFGAAEPSAPPARPALAFAP